MANNNIVELEKATRDLLLSVADILTAGGAPYKEALESISSLLRSTSILDPDKISRQAFFLTDQRDAISQKMSALINGGQPAGGVAKVKLDDETLPAEISALLVSLINHVLSLRPSYCQEKAAALIKQVENGNQLAQILNGFLGLVIQIRDDMWEERSKAFKHIEDILRILEATEKDFINSISSSHSYIIKSDQDFTAAMEDGLMEIGRLVAPAAGYTDLEWLCIQISEKVGKLHFCVQQKKAGRLGQDDHLGCGKENH